jgi:hypothetical protein
MVALKNILQSQRLIIDCYANYGTGNSKNNPFVKYVRRLINNAFQRNSCEQKNKFQITLLSDKKIQDLCDKNFSEKIQNLNKK